MNTNTSVVRALLMVVLLSEIVACTRASRSGNDVQRLLGKGEILMERGEYGEAIKCFNECIRIDEKSMMARVRRAQAWEGAGDQTNSLIDFEAATKLMPTDAEEFVLRGVSWNRLSDKKKAIADFDEALRLKPDFVEALVLRSGVYQKDGNYDAAINDLAEAIRIEPDNAKDLLAHKEIAICYLNRGVMRSWPAGNDDDAGIADFNSALKHDPEFVEVLSDRAHVHLHKQDYVRALEDFGEYIQSRPNAHSAFFNRGRIWIKKQEWSKAIADLKRATEINPKFLWYHEELAKAYAAVGDFQSAKNSIRAAIEVTDNRIQSDVSRLQSRLEKYERGEGDVQW